MAKKLDLAAAISASVNSLDACAPRTIETVTREILKLKENFAQSVMDIGARLNEAKGMMEHGAWLDWLENNVQFSERTAQNFMRLANEWTNPQALADLGTTKCVALLGIPQEEREEFITENDCAEISVRRVEDAVKAYRQKAEARPAIDFKTLDRAIERPKPEDKTLSPDDLTCCINNSWKQIDKSIVEALRAAAGVNRSNNYDITITQHGHSVPGYRVNYDAPIWRDGNPPKAGTYYAKFDIGKNACRLSEWSGWDWRFMGGVKIEAQCLGWYPLPED